MSNAGTGTIRGDAQRRGNRCNKKGVATEPTWLNTRFVPAARGSSLPLRWSFLIGTGEAYCTTPATPGLRGYRLIRLPVPRRSRAGSLTAQLAVRFPVSVYVIPLPYSPSNGLPIYTLGCWFGNASFIKPISKNSHWSFVLPSSCLKYSTPCQGI